MNSIINIFHLLRTNFLGQSPAWYKITIVAFLMVNPLLYYYVSPFVAGWVVLVEFIFTLACALKCYPLQPGGLIAIEALLIGLTNSHTVYREVLVNIPTLLLLIFMVAAIYFIKDVLFIAMTKLFLAIRKKYLLALVFCFICASLSAFLDALTLVAIAIAVCFNFYAIYHRVESHSGNEEELEEFRGFLRNLIMHGTVGTIVGGAMTLVGEPQNIMIGTKMGWHFMEFIAHCSVISFPAATAGFLVCFLLEFFKCPGFHYQMPERARELILKDYKKKIREMTARNFYVYVIQIFAFVLLVLALAFHVAEVGLIGVGLIVIVTAFTGLTREHDLGVAFTNAMPFAVLIVVFFAILGVVHEQHLVTPLAEWVFTFSGKSQLLALYFTNGTLSFVSDNVFIATIFINEVETVYANGIIAQMIDKIDAASASGTLIQFINDAKMAYDNEMVTQFIHHVESAYTNGTMTGFMNEMRVEYADKIIISRDEYEKLAVVVNMGTNIPAMATPNGHAALLFLLTSSLAPILKLSYFRMFKLALPYTIVMTLTGAAAIYFFL
ncbi:MAG: hypothetical protein FWC43_10185 [Planctomycetaceae bacterium]|nr:hypothetical protein [Planctomycetaceae bacterium]